MAAQPSSLRVAQAGGAYNPQGSSAYLQGSANTVQNTAPATVLQNTGNPQQSALYTGAVSTPPAPAPPPPDPYAKWGGIAGYQAAVDDYNKTRGLTYGSITDAIGDTTDATRSGILDYLSTYEQQQKGIDKQAFQSELKREQSRMGILDMIGQGLRSGGVMLNNANATNSSASDAIAKAYGRMGQKQMTQTNLGHSLEQIDIKDAQDALGINLETFKRKYGENKNSAANRIVQDAASSLAQLDSLAVSGGVGDRINVEAEKARIRNDALASLSALDTLLNEGVSKVKPTSREANRAEALKTIGGATVPEGALGFNTTLPIYTGA